ncbi:MAG: ribonuclease H-like domain-containing protein [Nitrospirae bacterium]|nr:ribonuclease H-like domain-containing protein [Nitrospirota bacterium]
MEGGDLESIYQAIKPHLEVLFDGSDVYILNDDKKWALIRGDGELYLKKLIRDTTGIVLTDQLFKTFLDIIKIENLSNQSHSAIPTRSARFYDDFYYNAGCYMVVFNKDGWEATGHNGTFRTEVLQIPHAGLDTNYRGTDVMGIMGKMISTKSSQDLLLLVVRTISLFIPGIAKPCLVYTGPQGSGKTTAANISKQTYDPTKTMRIQLSNTRDLTIAFARNQCIVFDNLSGIPQDLSDYLCGVITGMQHSERKLYTNGDVHTAYIKGTFDITSISIQTMSADLLDRSLKIELDRIQHRRTDEELAAYFGRNIGILLPAIFNVLVKAIGCYESVVRDERERAQSKNRDKYEHRLMDWYLWGVAISRAMGEEKEFRLAIRFQNELRTDDQLTMYSGGRGIILFRYLVENIPLNYYLEYTPTQWSDVLNIAAEGSNTRNKNKLFTAANVGKMFAALKVTLERKCYRCTERRDKENRYWRVEYFDDTNNPDEPDGTNAPDVLNNQHGVNNSEGCNSTPDGDGAPDDGGTIDDVNIQDDDCGTPDGNVTPNDNGLDYVLTDYDGDDCDDDLDVRVIEEDDDDDDGMTDDYSVNSSPVITQLIDNNRKYGTDDRMTDKSAKLFSNTKKVEKVRVEDKIKDNIYSNKVFPANYPSSVISTDYSNNINDLYDDRLQIPHFTTDTPVIESEDDIDLFSYPEDEIPVWEPSPIGKPFQELKQLYLDIETMGTDPETDRVIMIGLLRGWMKGDDSYICFSDRDEKKMLEDFNDYFAKEEFDVLVGHNIYKFDLEFIYQRMEYNRILPKRHIKKKEKSYMYDRQQYFATYMYGIDVLDTYISLSNYDYTAKTLSGYGLKNAVIELGLREARRLELSPSEIFESWNSGANDKIEMIKLYNRYDLEDTMLLSNKLHPILYYQKIMLPGYTFQEIACSGEGRKWNMALQRKYGYRPDIKADDKVEFEGGMVSLENIGLYKDVSKLDATSLYPSIMIRYGICSRKDVDKHTLSVMKYIKDKRVYLKSVAKQGNEEAKHFQIGMKNMINSQYGFLGSPYFQYNDVESAKKVTAYGRKIMKLMLAKMEIIGCTIISVDTDGVYFHHEDPRMVYDEVQRSLPIGIDIEIEIEKAYATYFPPQKKNYMVFLTPDKYFVKGGNFKGRDRCVLEKEFPFEYIRNILKSPESAKIYYEGVQDEIRSGELKLEKIMKCRKIRKNEKEILRLGKVGEKICYYKTDQTIIGKNGKESVAYYDDNKGAYSIRYYSELIGNIKNEIDSVIAQTVASMEEPF